MEEPSVPSQPVQPAAPLPQTPLPTPPVTQAPSSSRRKIWLLLLLGILVLGITAGGYYVYSQQIDSPKQQACTAEAKICPNGSSVGRTGPNCEFAPCPTPILSISTTENPNGNNPGTISDSLPRGYKEKLPGRECLWVAPHKTRDVTWSFTLPEGWKQSTISTTGTSAVELLGLEVQSPDYAVPEYGNNPSQIPGSGARIQLSARCSDYSSLEEIINHQNISSYIVSTIRHLEIKGVPAIQFEHSYEGDTSTDTWFIKDGIWYSLGMGYGNAEKKDEYLKMLASLITSMEIKTVEY